MNWVTAILLHTSLRLIDLFRLANVQLVGVHCFSSAEPFFLVAIERAAV